MTLGKIYSKKKTCINNINVVLFGADKMEAKNVALRRRRYICRLWRDWACSSTAINRSWWRSSIHSSIRLAFLTTLTTLGCPGCQTTISRSAKCISRRAELRRGNITTSLRPRLIVRPVFAFLPWNSVETSFEMSRCIPIDESWESIWYWVTHIRYIFIAI